MPARHQLRSLPSASSQLRAEKRGDKSLLVGYAAVFYKAGDPGTEYRLFPDMVERIMPGAFDAAIREDDVRALYNHDVDAILGRRRPGHSAPTLRLSVDSIGLLYEIDLPDTQAARDLRASLDRQDIDGSSFAFETSVPYGAKRGSVTWREVDGLTIREISDLELYDVGPVTYPAYTASTAGLRSDSEDGKRLLAELDAWRRGNDFYGDADDRDELLLASALAQPLTRPSLH